MSHRWQRIARVLLVASVVLLMLSSGVALADEDHGTDTSTTTPTTTTTTDGHHDETSTANSTADGHHEGTSSHTEESTGHSDGEHAHDGEKTGTSTGHHDDSAQQSSDGHSHGDDGHSEGGLLGSWVSVIGGLFLLGTVVTAPTYRYLTSSRDGFTATPVHLVAALLAILTAAVHLYLFLEHGEVVMLLAGAGFLGGIALFFSGFTRRYLYAGGVLFTLVQIPLWVLEGMPHVESFGLLDKVAQVLLIGVLGYLYFSQR